MSLTREQIDIIKATVPVVQEHGTSITTVFYDNMLREHPELKAVFNQAHQATGHQARALAGALYAYAANIDNLEALGPAVKLITHKHASLYIKPADYDIVGEYLLAAMKQVLGDACTPAILGAWEAAYWQLAHILIGEEAKLYQQDEDWNDWRRFRIARKIRESDEIISFYLEPADEKRPLPSFRPGQYISVRVFVPGLEHAQARQYSLSDAPRSDYYRISVKKEAGLDIAKEGAEKHPGYVSNILHDNKEENDIVEVSHPYGDFFLTSEAVSHPVVLLSAGVGITPMISILNTLTAQSQSHPQRRIHFIHGARRDSGRAFQEHIQHTVAQHPDVKATFFNTSPAQHEQKGVHYHYVGRVDLQNLDEKADLFIDNAHAEYYICGPEGFMTNTFKALCQRGVDPSRIKMELFGTGGVPKDVLTTEKRMKVNSRLNPVPWALPALIATVGVGLGISFYRKHADQMSLGSALTLWSVTVGAAVMVFTPTMRS